MPIVQFKVVAYIESNSENSSEAASFVPQDLFYDPSEGEYGFQVL